jgi:hypothetical protein
MRDFVYLWEAANVRKAFNDCNHGHVQMCALDSHHLLSGPLTFIEFWEAESCSLKSIVYLGEVHSCIRFYVSKEWKLLSYVHRIFCIKIIHICISKYLEAYPKLCEAFIEFYMPLSYNSLLIISIMSVT